MLSAMLLALVLFQSTDSAPQTPPSSGRSSERRDEAWDLEYAPGPMRLYRDPASRRAYWYTTFSITNRSGQDRFIAPRWELADVEGRVYPEGRDVPSDVQRAIQRLLNDPDMQESHGVMGAIAQGPAGVRTGFVVFPAGPEVRRFSLYVSGLSSAVDRVKDVKTGEQVTVRKALRVDYQVPGDRQWLDGPVPLAEPENGTSNPSWIYR